MELPQIKGEIYQDYSLSKLNTWKVGGKAEIVAWPQDAEDFQIIVRWAGRKSFPLYILGHGSNVLLPDMGLKGLVIVTRQMKNICWQGNTVLVAAGYSLTRLAREAADRSLSGLEFAAGIPGTVGGAVIMNAGAHGSAMENIVEKAVFLTPEGEITEYAKDRIQFSYRSTSLAGLGGWVLEAVLRLDSDDPVRIKELMKQYTEKRKASQPLEYPNAGSVFKNPPGKSAGRLIEQTGLKGYSQGGAQVSLKHANFIINKGKASAEDILTLIKIIQNQVYEQHKIWLETEVEFFPADGC